MSYSSISPSAPTTTTWVPQSHYVQALNDTLWARKKAEENAPGAPQPEFKGPPDQLLDHPRAGTLRFFTRRRHTLTIPSDASVSESLSLIDKEWVRSNDKLRTSAPVPATSAVSQPIDIPAALSTLEPGWEGFLDPSSGQSLEMLPFKGIDRMQTGTVVPAPATSRVGGQNGISQESRRARQVRNSFFMAGERTGSLVSAAA